MRSTPEEARLEAMASPLEMNSSVMLARMERAETYHVTAASGTSAATRKSMIFPRRPSLPRRSRGSISTCCCSCRDSRLRAIGVSSGSGADGRGPIGNGHPAFTLHAGEVHAVETLMALRSEAERRADAEVEALERLERLLELGACGVGAGLAQRFHADLRRDETFQADEAVSLWRVRPVPERLGQRR